jgi:quercetin dioxygenase-like cupin family protein
MKLRFPIIGVVLAACLAGTGVILAREPDGQSAVTAQQLFTEALAGEEGKEVVAQTYELPPGAVLPWHIHPDAHEIAYILEGTLTFEQAGKQPIEIKADEADYLPPNVVHRGMNRTDKPIKLFVVRIKPKDKPLVQEVPPQ